MTGDRRVYHLILQSGRVRRHSFGEASYQLGIGLDADQAASRIDHRGNVGRGDTQAAAELHNGRAIPEKAPDHPGLGTLIGSPEHLRPYSRRNIGTSCVKLKPLVAYPVPGKCPDNPAGRFAGHQARCPELDWRCSHELLVLVSFAGHREQYAWAT